MVIRTSASSHGSFYGYRIRQWPDLPAGFFTPPILGALSRLGRACFSLHSFATAAELKPVTAEALLNVLVTQAAVERVDFFALCTDEHCSSRTVESWTAA